MQIEGFLPTLLHHELDPQENVPEVELISMKGARQFTRSQVLKAQQIIYKGAERVHQMVGLLFLSEGARGPVDPRMGAGGYVFMCGRHIYLVERKREDIRRHIFLPVYVVNLLNPVVIHANDAQVKFLDAQDVPQRVHILAQPGAAKRHHLLEIPQHYSHFYQKLALKRLNGNF